MKILSTLFLMVFASTVFGQTKLEGTVTDAETGEPVIFATVALSQNGVLKTGTETDFDGYYSFTELELGEYEIEVSNTGYKPMKFAKARIEKVAVYKFDVKLTVGFELSTSPGCGFSLPLVRQDDTTQGHVFRIDDIKHSPSRN